MVEFLLSVFLMTTHFKGKWYVVFLFCITFCFFLELIITWCFVWSSFKKKNYTKPSYGCIESTLNLSHLQTHWELLSLNIYIFGFFPWNPCMTPLRAACSCLLHSCCWGLPCVIILGFPFTSFLCGLRFPKNLPSSSLVYLLFWSVHPPVVSWKRKKKMERYNLLTMKDGSGSRETQ